MRQYATARSVLHSGAPLSSRVVVICCSNHSILGSLILGLPFETLWTKHFFCVYYVNNIKNLCCFQSCFLFIFSEVVMNFLKKTCFVIHQSVTKHILMSLFKAEYSQRNHLISFLEKKLRNLISGHICFVVSNICNSQVKTLMILFNDTIAGPILYFIHKYLEQ